MDYVSKFTFLYSFISILRMQTEIEFGWPIEKVKLKKKISPKFWTIIVIYSFKMLSGRF